MLYLTFQNAESPNVLLDAGLKVKLADFGLSRVRESTMQTAATAGTLTHMAPECFEGEYSRKTDVYAFAMTCWEIATQDWPMRNFPNQAVLMNAVINKNARPEVHMIPSDVIRQLLIACWHADAKQRPLFEQIQITLKPLKDQNPATKKQIFDLESVLEK